MNAYHKGVPYQHQRLQLYGLLLLAQLTIPLLHYPFQIMMGLYFLQSTLHPGLCPLIPYLSDQDGARRSRSSELDRDIKYLLSDYLGNSPVWWAINACFGIVTITVPYSTTSTWLFFLDPFYPLSPSTAPDRQIRVYRRDVHVYSPVLSGENQRCSIR
ncbi:hypothetical protein F4805DRAFT_115188 [Annulohypoxylon moriforme]|nr:hypothetical protein F4805DRAFT_115188 [Annulohypoxylon moriforme]